MGLTNVARQLDDALWVYQIAFRIPISISLDKLMFGKACHIPIELEY